jgi:hypothetical protein
MRYLMFIFAFLLSSSIFADIPHDPNPQMQAYFFAEKSSDGTLISSGNKVGSVKPAMIGLSPHLCPVSFGQPGAVADDESGGEHWVLGIGVGPE